MYKVPTDEGDPGKSVSQTSTVIFGDRKKWPEPSELVSRACPYGDPWNEPEPDGREETPPDDEPLVGPCYICTRDGVTPPPTGVLIVGRHFSKRSRCEFAARGYVCTRHIADFSVFQQVG